MKKSHTPLLHLVMIAAATLLAGCERPPIEAVQHGFRGTGMVEVYNPRTIATQAKLNEVPAPIAPATPGGPAAAQVYQNVQVQRPDGRRVLPVDGGDDIVGGA
jgi:photosynthetic reaction center cytochrome c subunit